MEISEEVVRAMGLRLLFLQTHYRKPLDFTADKHLQAMKIWLRWYKAAECDEGEAAGVDLLEALCDDMNIPKAIAIMHSYHKQKEAGKLFAAMKLLGLIPGHKSASISDMEQKTVSPECEAMMEAKNLGVAYA